MDHLCTYSARCSVAGCLTTDDDSSDRTATRNRVWGSVAEVCRTYLTGLCLVTHTNGTSHFCFIAQRGVGNHDESVRVTRIVGEVLDRKRISDSRT